MTINVLKCHPDAQIPEYQTDGAGCFDLSSIEDGEVNLFNGSAIFGTGLKFEIPHGHSMFIFSRSGHGFKNDIRLANCVGVIDSDYRGEVKVKITLDGADKFNVKKGDRIAQATILPTPQIKLVEVSELGETVRGANGFGSTNERKFFGQPSGE